MLSSDLHLLGSFYKARSVVLNLRYIQFVTSFFVFCLFAQNYADQAESARLRENNSQTERECSNLMKTLRMTWLDPVLTDLQDRHNTDFLVLEERLKSAYHQLDSVFRMQAPGSKSLCSNLAYIYELVRGPSPVVFITLLFVRRSFAF